MPESVFISPEDIHRIREAREESQEAFAEEAGVSSGTIHMWEKGELALSDEHAETLQELIPEELESEEIVEEVVDVDDWAEQIPPSERKLFGSKWMQTLREKPRTAEALEGGMRTFTQNQRMFVRRLEVGSSKGTAEPLGGHVTTVYYLEGDERRAMRLFIEENQELLAKAFQKQQNRFSGEWDDFHYGMLEEEWRFWICGSD